MSIFRSDNNGDVPSNDNPIRTFFDSYQRETPMITRSITTIQAIAYFVNIFFDLRLGLGNIPVFTVYKFEFYRIFTSLFICTGFISLVLAYFSFLPTGKRLEYSMGSTEFACILLTIGVMTNIIYVCLTFVLDYFLGSRYWLAIPSYGLWNVMFGVISMECRKAPQNSARKFFIWTIPTLYFPMALLILFSFLGGFSFAHLISVILGYGFGYGYLDNFRISATRCKFWEEMYLHAFVNQDRNYIVSSTAMGSRAWSNDVTTQSGRDQSGLRDFISRWSSPTHHQLPISCDIESNDLTRSGISRPGRTAKQSTILNDGNVSKNFSPTSVGQQLGGDSQVKNQDPRQLRLEAVERRVAKNSER